jgi:hypothetical protein
MAAESNQWRVRGFSVTGVYDEPRIRPPVAPIIDGMGWRWNVSLYELRLNFVNCTEYGNSMVYNEKVGQPQRINMDDLKLLQLHECDGNIELIDGIGKGSVNIETFLF